MDTTNTKNTKKAYSFLTDKKVKPVASDIVKQSNKTILGLIHVIVFSLLDKPVLTAQSNMIYVTLCAGYTSAISNTDSGKNIALKNTTFDAKKRIHTTLKDSYNVLNGTASPSTLSKFDKSLNKLAISSDTISAYFVYACNSLNLDIKKAKNQAVKNNKKSKLQAVITSALNKIA